MLQISIHLMLLLIDLAQKAKNIFGNFNTSNVIVNQKKSDVDTFVDIFQYI